MMCSVWQNPCFVRGLCSAIEKDGYFLGLVILCSNHHSPTERIARMEADGCLKSFFDERETGYYSYCWGIIRVYGGDSDSQWIVKSLSELIFILYARVTRNSALDNPKGHVRI
ncbi:hypothetical protein OROHE_000429 [Orobanche hederae]